MRNFSVNLKLGNMGKICQRFNDDPFLVVLRILQKTKKLENRGRGSAITLK